MTTRWRDAGFGPLPHELREAAPERFLLQLIGGRHPDRPDKAKFGANDALDNAVLTERFDGGRIVAQLGQNLVGVLAQGWRPASKCAG